MGDRSTKRESGFSLLEMVIAMAMGTILMGAAVQLYSQGVAATWTVSQRAELQQDFRAASNILTRDMSLAGAGLGADAAIHLPTPRPFRSIGCDQTRRATSAAPTTARGRIPCRVQRLSLWADHGIRRRADAQQPEATDTVTVVYTDTYFSFELLHGDRHELDGT